jgi:hypothetical protein
MPGDGTLDLSAVTTPGNFQDELPESMRAFQDLPPLSPLPSPAAIAHSNEATDHEEEDNTDHIRETALQNSSYSPATAPLDNILALDQNRSLISPNAASFRVLPSPSAPSNQPVDNPPEEIVDTRESEAERYAQPNEASIQPNHPLTGNLTQTRSKLIRLLKVLKP